MVRRVLPLALCALAAVIGFALGMHLGTMLEQPARATPLVKAGPKSVPLNSGVEHHDAVVPEPEPAPVEAPEPPHAAAVQPTPEPKEIAGRDDETGTEFYEVKGMPLQSGQAEEPGRDVDMVDGPVLDYTAPDPVSAPLADQAEAKSDNAAAPSN